MIAFRNPEDEAYYRSVVEFAEKTGQLKQLRSQLWILHTFGENGHPRFEEQRKALVDPVMCYGTTYSRAWLYKDFAPYSFNVRLERRIGKLSATGDRMETNEPNYRDLELIANWDPSAAPDDPDGLSIMEAIDIARRVLSSIRAQRHEYQPWMDMGLLYHDSHDDYGSGSAPTFAVTLEATQGWSIHS